MRVTREDASINTLNLIIKTGILYVHFLVDFMTRPKPCRYFISILVGSRQGFNPIEII